MKDANKFGTFFVPGPTDVRPEILEAMSGQMIPHRSPQFEALFARAQTGLRHVFQTTQPVVIAASSGTGMMECAVRCVRPGPILCLVNGAFSERFAMISRACGHESVTYEVPWSEVHDPAKVDELLAGGKFSAVTVVHSETSTGARNPIREISDVAHRHGARCLIDSVSGLGGLELRFDEWGLDFVLTGSQKALALPPGLSFGAASEDFIREASTAPVRGIYFDLIELIAFAKKGQTPSTPAVSLFYALVAQLDAIVAEGIESRWAKHATMAKLVSEWSDSVAQGPDGGFSNIVRKESRSNTVSTIRLPEGWAAPDFLKAVRELGFSLGGGYGKLAGSTFRIGHLGDHTPDTVRTLLSAITATEHDQTDS